MKNREITYRFEELQYDELSEEDKRLVDRAKEMTATSYVPYSHFHVGAAILMDNGEVVGGSNQENAAFPVTICAERNACFQASALYPGVRMRKIAIAAWTRLHKSDETPDWLCFQHKPISPCGVCRQALLEYETMYGPMEVLLYGLDCVYRIPSVRDLLPFSFTEF